MSAQGRTRRLQRTTIGVLAIGWAAMAAADDSGLGSQGGLADTGGASIYGHICQGCHMPEGQGAIGAGYYPKLAGDPALVSWEYAALTVLGGKNGMPAFGLPADRVEETRTVHLSDQQIADVINYVRGHFGNHYKPAVTAKQVAALPHP